MVEITADKYNAQMVKHGCRNSLLRDFRKICRVFAEDVAENAKTDGDRHHMMFEVLRAAKDGIREGFGWEE